MNLFDKIMSGESDFDKEDQRAEMQRLFKDKIKENIDSILPAIMKTGTSVDEEIFKKKEENQIFGLMNLANKLVNLEDKQTQVKSLNAIELSNIISFSIFPSLISIFCLN